MIRRFLGSRYFAAHLAAAYTCIAIFVIVPFLAMLAVSHSSGDFGGPLFWPIFPFLLVFLGLVIAAVLSAAVTVSDFACSRIHVPLWLPPLIVFCVIFMPASLRSTDWRQSFLASFIAGLAVSLAFALYWLSVSSDWFLPRKFRSILQQRFGVPREQQSA
ncbi:MAG TPA: hypothetical protein VF585_12170 [Chthoniobacterales bacterium]|jgi:hypothetical protein